MLPDANKTKDSYLALAARHAATLYGPPEVVLTHGKGPFLYDTEGTAFLDFAGGMGVHLLGHAHPRLVAAMQTQAVRLLHTSNAYLSPEPLKLAAKLSLATGYGQCFFVNSGTEAMEGALKLARRHHFLRKDARSKFVAMRGGFHGRTLGALSVTGQPALHEGFAPLLGPVCFIPFNDLAAADAAIDGQTAAVVVEVVQGNGGVVLPAPGYLPALKALCAAQGALLIVDEVQTGMGRLGHWLGGQAFGLEADIVCMAKALGGGLPLGAVLAQQEIMAALGPGSHGSTFGGNPVACAAALALMEVVTEEALLPRVQAFGATLLPRLQKLPHVTAVRGRGLLWGLEGERVGSAALRQACLAEGLLTTQAGPRTLRLFLPALLGEQELADGLARLARAFAKAHAAP